MNLLGWVSVVCAVASLVVTGAIVLGNPAAMDQVRALEFPLTDLGESTIAMVLPLVLTALALPLGALGYSRSVRHARHGLVLDALSAVAVFVVLGARGFQYLF